MVGENPIESISVDASMYLSWKCQFGLIWLMLLSSVVFRILVMYMPLYNIHSVCRINLYDQWSFRFQWFKSFRDIHLLYISKLAGTVIFRKRKSIWTQLFNKIIFKSCAKWMNCILYKIYNKYSIHWHELIQNRKEENDVPNIIYIKYIVSSKKFINSLFRMSVQIYKILY